MTSNNEHTENTQYFADNEWLIRESSIYKKEYEECTSIKGRLHQYFIFGDFVDCSQWKRDFNNACKWEESKDKKAVIELINSEKARRTKRLTAHFDNDVWEKRISPPEDFNAPLPDYISSKYENTYLDIKSKELKGQLPRSSDITFTTTFCTIL
ncbi:hypothetical protein WA026_022511 [Henosepilachna vigintioctopunctata]|uniref:Synaptic plasticity regulator PANTS n=1 Tax=Henosepilachna vigintioctopunctata TaxID=420089 RepID=A0AAW1UGD3_9CUCU